MSSPILVALQADTGKWFTRCRNCQKTVGDNPDTVTIHVDKPTADQPYARFEVVNVGGGKIALKADTGKYVARCRGCIVGGAKEDFVTIHVTDPSAAHAQFTPVLLDNGKYALRADTGKYVTRCRGCSPGAAYPDTVTIHVDNPQDAYAQWRIIPVSFPTGSKIALQADTGKWFTRCRNCQKTVGDNPDTVTIHVDKPTADQPYARFEVVNVGGGKIALKADTGKYVARCRGCIVGGAKEDFVTIHVTDPSAAHAQFTPVLLDNGKYALRADTGKYVTRCRGCSPGAAYPDTVTIHVDNPQDAYAQWNIIYLS